MSQVINVIGDSPDAPPWAEIVDINAFGLAFPAPTRVVEIANQFFFLAIDTDDRMSCLLEEN